MTIAIRLEHSANDGHWWVMATQTTGADISTSHCEPEDRKRNVRDALLNATLQLASAEGLEAISLRSVSAAIGKSTTVIFQNFGGRQGLLDATMEYALALEEGRHAELSKVVEPFPIDPDALGDLTAHYIRLADRSNAARFCLEAALQADCLTNPVPSLQRWMDARRSFWTQAVPDDEPLAWLLSEYTMIEQAFCAALQGEFDYELLMRRTARSACRSAGTVALTTSSQLTDWALERAFPEATEEPAHAAPMERLLAVVAERIAREGLGDINLRRIAADEGVSPSLIVYHFQDFAKFTTTAIWRAMMHDLPAYLDERQSADTNSHADWLRGLETAIDPKATDGSQAFYVRYARILGQVCLLARKRPELVPLVRQLRAIEGMGIHHASQDVWPGEFRLSPGAASAFSIWIKARALANLGTGDSPERISISAMLRFLSGTTAED